MLCYGGMLAIINSVYLVCLCSCFHFFEIPRGVPKKIEYCRSIFYLQNNQHNKKYALARWNNLWQPKDQGLMGIHNLDKQNNFLLSKRLFKLCNADTLCNTPKGIQYHLGTKMLLQMLLVGLVFLRYFPLLCLCCTQTDSLLIQPPLRKHARVSQLL